MYHRVITISDFNQPLESLGEKKPTAILPNRLNSMCSRIGRFIKWVEARLLILKDTICGVMAKKVGKNTQRMIYHDNDLKLLRYKNMHIELNNDLSLYTS